MACAAESLGDKQRKARAPCDSNCGARELRAEATITANGQGNRQTRIEAPTSAQSTEGVQPPTAATNHRRGGAERRAGKAGATAQQRTGRTRGEGRGAPPQGGSNRWPPDPKAEGKSGRRTVSRHMPSRIGWGERGPAGQGESGCMGRLQLQSATPPPNQGRYWSKAPMGGEGGGSVQRQPLSTNGAREDDKSGDKISGGKRERARGQRHCIAQTEVPAPPYSTKVATYNGNRRAQQRGRGRTCRESRRNSTAAEKKIVVREGSAATWRQQLRAPMGGGGRPATAIAQQGRREGKRRKRRKVSATA